MPVLGIGDRHTSTPKHDMPPPYSVKMYEDVSLLAAYRSVSPRSVILSCHLT